MNRMITGTDRIFYVNCLILYAIINNKWPFVLMCCKNHLYVYKSGTDTQGHNEKKNGQTVGNSK